MKSSEEFGRNERLIIRNRKAGHDFLISSKIECGIALSGTEVKSLRAGKCSMTDAYAGFNDKRDFELWLYNFHINEYDFGNRENHLPKRPRKLLVNHREAVKLKNQTAEKGMTLVPLALYFSGHLVKVEIGVARAKHKFDKRQSEREREHTKELRKDLKFRI
jgi:SsrA-binding protein